MSTSLNTTPAKVRAPAHRLGEHRRRGPARSSPLRSRLQISLVLGALLLPVLVVVVAGHNRSPNAVLNPSGAVNPSDWRASSAATVMSVTRVEAPNAPEGATTAIEIQRSGDGGNWALALAGLRSPASFFQRGHTYRMQVWVRDLLASGQSVGILLANSNFEHRPTDTTRYERYGDAEWHLLQCTFVVTAPAAADTSLYLALPVNGSLRWDFTMASVREVDPPQPRETRGMPDTRITFSGPAGSPPDSAVWNHEVGGHGWGDDEVETYTTAPQNAYVDGQGHLVIAARREDATGPDGITRHYTSARLNTQGKVEIQPGSYVEAEIRATAAAGTWPDFWLIGANWPQVGWPASGELDILEGSRRSSSTVRQTIHMSRLSSPRDDAPYGENAPGGYTSMSQPRDAATHLYGVYFDRNLVQFYVDRKPTLRLTADEASQSDRSWPFDRPQLIVMNVGVTADADQAAFPATMTVGPIAIWSRGVPF